MNKQKQTQLLIVGAVIAIIVVGYFITTGIPGVTKPEEGETTNGLWDQLTGECKSDPNNNNMFFTCCFNKEGQQVDCNSDEIIGPGHGNVFAIYKGEPGKFTISHGVKLINTGNMAFDGSITSIGVSALPTFTAGVTALNTAYAGMINVAKPVAIGSYAEWSSAVITLQNLAPIGTLETYTINVNAKGSSSGLDDVTKSASSTFTVDSEGINFDISISF